MNKLNKLLFVFLALALLLCGCSTKTANNLAADNTIKITDSGGKTVILPSTPKVVSCHASLSECWLLAGGDLVGVTEDVISDRGLLKENNAKVIGTVKNIDMEKVAALNPDYVILSSDLAAHIRLKTNLDKLNIPYGFFKEDTFNDYSSVMSAFCGVTGRQDLFNENVTAVKQRIDEIKAKIPKGTTKTALLARVFSTGMKAKTDDNSAGIILKELGIKNIVEDHPSALDELSTELIIKSNPDFVLTYAMGDEDGAKAYLKSNFEDSPAFNGLKAVKNNCYHLLPKRLFHYKPNNRWDESYEYLAKIIYPEIFK